MDDLTDQIRAWADATAPGEDHAVAAEDIVVGRVGPSVIAARSNPPRRMPRLVLAAAAIVAVVAGVALVLAVVDRSPSPRVRADAPDRSVIDGSTTTPAPTGPVAFDVLSVAQGSQNTQSSLQSVLDQTQLDQLWVIDGLAGQVPDVDFDRQSVVSMTIPDDACPPTLDGFDREGSTLRPRFVEPPGPCIQPLLSRTYIVALDWASTGPAYRVSLPGRPGLGSDQPTYLDVDRSASTVGLSARFELPTHRVVAGGTIAGQVIVDNGTGKPIWTNGCGPVFAVGLVGATANYEVIRPACVKPTTIPTGRSVYSVVVHTVYSGCTMEGPDSVDTPRCTEDGSAPLPPGEYQARLDQVEDLVPLPEPTTITVT